MIRQGERNLGMGFEDEIRKSNEGYRNRKMALVQKISTPWRVVRRGKQIISAFPEGKSTLDFRGTIKGGMSISFDCKETDDERGLPLVNIEYHQIEYMRDANDMGEITFILCYLKKANKRYLIPGEVVLHHWDSWRAHKGMKGYNYIPAEKMIEIEPSGGIVLDYIQGLKKTMEGLA